MRWSDKQNEENGEEERKRWWPGGMYICVLRTIAKTKKKLFFPNQTNTNMTSLFLIPFVFQSQPAQFVFLVFLLCSVATKSPFSPKTPNRKHPFIFRMWSKTHKLHANNNMLSPTLGCILVRKQNQQQAEGKRDAKL